MNRSAQTGLRLAGLAVAVEDTAANDVAELDTDPFTVALGEAGVVVAAPPVGRAFADVLAGLASPVRGDIWLGGVAVTGKPPGERRVGLVPAGGGLLPHLTVERNVAFGLAGKTSRSQQHALVSEVLGGLELTGLRRLRPHEISPGERLRVAVARAMCAAPVQTMAVVVEDGASAAICRAAVRTAADQDLAVVLVTSDPARAAGIGPHAEVRCR